MENIKAKGIGEDMLLLIVQLKLSTGCEELVVYFIYQCIAYNEKEERSTVLFLVL